MGGLVLQSGDSRRQQRRSASRVMSDGVRKGGFAHVEASTPKPKHKFFWNAKKQESKHDKEDGREYQTDLSNSSRSLQSERQVEEEKSELAELSLEAEPEPIASNYFDFKLEDLAKGMSGAFESLFDNAPVLKNLFLVPVESPKEEVDVAQTGAAESKEESLAFAAVATNTSIVEEQEQEQTVKEEPKKKKALFGRTKRQPNDHQRGTEVKKLEQTVRSEQQRATEERINDDNPKSVGNEEKREPDNTQLKITCDDRDKAEDKKGANKVVANNRNNNTVNEEMHKTNENEPVGLHEFRIVGGAQPVISALSRTSHDKEERADGEVTGAEENHRKVSTMEDETIKEEVEVSAMYEEGQTKDQEKKKKKKKKKKEHKKEKKSTMEDEPMKEEVEVSAMNGEDQTTFNEDQKMMTKKKKEHKKVKKSTMEDEPMKEEVEVVAMNGEDQTTFNEDQKMMTKKKKKKEHKKEKTEEKKEKRVTFWLTKRRQNDRKDGAAVNKLDLIQEEIYEENDQKCISGDEKRELDDTQLIITSEDGDKGDCEKGADGVVDEEANNRKNNTVDEEMQVGRNDFAIVGGAQSVVSAPTQTFDHHDRATLHGNSNHKVNLSEMMPILDEGSNSLIENSVREDATFQINPTVLEEYNKNVEKNTKKDKQETDKSKGNTFKVQDFFLCGNDGADTVVSGLTLVSGQTKWTRFFCPAKPVREEKDDEKSMASKFDLDSKICVTASVVSKKEIEEEAVEEIEVQHYSSIPSPFVSGDVHDGDEDSVVSGLTLASGQTKWTHYFSPEMEPIHEGNYDEKSNASKLRQDGDDGGRVDGSASKSTRAKLPSSASVPSKTQVTTSARSVASFGNASKSSKTKQLSSASVASKPQVATSARSVASFGNASKSSKAKLLSSASVASKPQVATSARSVASFGNASKSSKAKLLSSASVPSKPQVATSARSVASFGNASKSSKAKQLSSASVPSKHNVATSVDSVKSCDDRYTVPTSADSVASCGNASHYSEINIHQMQAVLAKLPLSSSASVASKPNVPTSARSVASCNSSTSYEDSIGSCSSSSTASSIAVKSVYSSQIRREDTDFFAHEPEVPTSARSVASCGNKSKSSKVKLPSSASVASKLNVPTSAGSVKSNDNSSNQSSTSRSTSRSTSASERFVEDSSDSDFAQVSEVATSARSVNSCGNFAQVSEVATSARSVNSCGNFAQVSEVATSARSVASCGNKSKSSKVKLPSSASVASKLNVPTSEDSVKSNDNSSTSSTSSSTSASEQSEEDSSDSEEDSTNESESSSYAPKATKKSWLKKRVICT